MKKIYMIGFLVLGFLSCQDEVKNKVEELVEAPSFKINPPLIGKETLPDVYKIDNTKDTVLISDRGSFVSVPKNCFVDEEGNEVNSNVEIELTEYLNPADILLSGIPMVFMENEDTMDFQSAGMCKILATSNQKPLQLKQDKDIKIGLRNLAQDNDYNLYYFDTLKGNWEEKQKNINPLESDNLPIAPVSLQQTNSDKIVTINIRQYQIRPLYKMWHKSKFKIYGEAKIAEPDSSIWWYDMSVSPSKNPSIYELKFNGVDGNANQCTQQMMVQPTIDSLNYEAEMSIFYENMRAYVAELEKIGEELEQSKIEAENIDAMWDEQRRLDSIDAVKQMVEDSINFARELEYHKVAETRVEVMRSFSIKQMGIYNCDRFYKRQIVETKQIGFKVSDVNVFFDNAYLVNKYSNAVLNYVPFTDNGYSIGFDSEEYAFVGILGGDIYLSKLHYSDSNQSKYDVTINKITVDELNKIMGT